MKITVTLAEVIAMGKDGPVRTALTYSDVKKWEIKDGFLQMTVPNDKIVGVNLAGLLEFAIDPYGSVALPNAGLALPGR